MMGIIEDYEILKEKFSDVDLLDLKYFLGSHIQSRRCLSRICTQYNLLQLLEKRQLIHPQNVAVLKKFAEQSRLKDLVARVNSYEKQHCQQPASCCNVNYPPPDYLNEDEYEKFCRRRVLRRLEREKLDAVVIYADDTHAGVEELFQCLNQWKIRHKSFLAARLGEPILETVLANIESSRCVLLFITENFNSCGTYTRHAIDVSLDKAVKGKLKAIPVSATEGLHCDGWEHIAGITWNNEKQKMALKVALQKMRRLRLLEAVKTLDTDFGQSLLSQEMEAEHVNR